jgi:hypothetical protein
VTGIFLGWNKIVLRMDLAFMGSMISMIPVNRENIRGSVAG